MRKIQGGDGCLQDVFPDRLARAGMDQRIFSDYECNRKRLQEARVFRCQGILCPLHGAAGVGVEGAHIEAVQRRPVMIARQAKLRQLPQVLDALVGIGTITNHIAQAPHIIPVAFAMRENGFKSGVIGVNIRDDEDSH